MGVEEVSFRCLEAGELALGVWEPAKKVRRLPSCLEGPGSQPGAMVVERVQPGRVRVICWNQEGMWLKFEREGSCTLGVGIVWQTRNRACR